MSVAGKYSSVWDDGASEVETDVRVNLDTMEIVEWGYSSTTIQGDAESEDELENLCEEYVTIGSKIYRAMSKQDYEEYGKDDPEYYDEYGNGILLYDWK